MKKRANELDGKTWLQYSFSIWRDIAKTDEERKLGHPAMFPIQLASRLIEIFSKREDLILDPFLGSGSTLIAAKILGRQGIGIELSGKYVALAKRRVKNLQLNLTTRVLKILEPKIYNANVFDTSKLLKPDSVDLVITSPPYWDILTERRSADRKAIRKYSDSKDDLGNIHNYEEFIEKLGMAFAEIYKVLKVGKYCVVVVMDIRKKSKFYPFHLDLIKKLNELGYIIDDIIIWDRQKEYNNMRPLGYPSVFRVNKVHEYILIFKK